MVHVSAAHGTDLSGARAYSRWRAPACFNSPGQLKHAKVPAWGLVLQGVWAIVSCWPRTYTRQPHLRISTGEPARLRDLRGADLLHPDDRGIFFLRLRRRDPPADRPLTARFSAIGDFPRSTSSALRHTAGAVSVYRPGYDVAGPPGDRAAGVLVFAWKPKN